MRDGLRLLTGEALRRTEMDVQRWVAEMLAGDPIACGRLLTVVEGLDPASDQVLAAIFDRLGRAHRIGLTGPPGAGKSSLCLHLTKAYRARDLKVGVVAVDPTSPLSGGAVLGDRIRMNELSTDGGVFIRSLASRGSYGGLSAAAGRVADVLDAFGCDIVLLETVGMGQVGDDIRQQTATTVVVLVPESGDGVQFMKAGMLELADIFVVNKSDRPGAADLLRQLRNFPVRAGRAWTPPMLATSAVAGDGIDELVAALDAHRAHRGERAEDVGRAAEFWYRRFTRLAERAVIRDFRAVLRARAVEDKVAVKEVVEGGRNLGSLLRQTVESFYRSRET